MAVALAYKQYGEGPPLVILHGLFGSSINWVRIARRLAKDWAVHTPDLRNHGESDWSHDVAYESLADDVVRFLDHAGIGRATIIGHSMGGKVAMTLSLRNPERVKALLVVDIAPVVYPPSLRVFTHAMKSVDLDTVGQRSDVDRLLQPGVPNAGVRAFLLQNIVLQDDAFCWRINLDALDAGIETISGFPRFAAERAYNGPVMFMVGGRSNFIKPEYHQAMRDMFPRAGLDVVEHAGHWIHTEDPDTFLEHANRFLSTLERHG